MSEYFNPDKDLAWYSRNHDAHVKDGNREAKKRYKLEVEIIRKRKKAMALTTSPSSTQS
jgi:hypothetical protein